MFTMWKSAFQVSVFLAFATACLGGIAYEGNPANQRPSKNTTTATPPCVLTQSECIRRFGEPVKGDVTCEVKTCHQGVPTQIEATYSCRQGLHVSGNATRVCTLSRGWFVSTWECSGKEAVCSVPASQCPEPNMLPYHYRCYRINEGLASSQMAAQRCRAEGGTLAEVVNEGLDRFLVRSVQDRNMTRAWVHSYHHPQLGIVQTTNQTLAKERECGLIEKRNRVTHTTWVLRVYKGAACNQRLPYICQFESNEETATQCSLLPHPANGRRQSIDTNLGSSVRFKCSQGYKLTGPAVRTCTPAGVWSGDEPQCTPTSCTISQVLCERYFGRPSYGSVKCNVTSCDATGRPLEVVGDYHCGADYRIAGSATRKCSITTINGRYFYPQCPGYMPTCSINRALCPKPYHLSFGTLCYDIQRGPLQYADAVQKCNDGGGALAQVVSLGLDVYLTNTANVMGVHTMWIDSYQHPSQGIVSSGRGRNRCPYMEKSSSRAKIQWWMRVGATPSDCAKHRGYICEHMPAPSVSATGCSVLPVPTNGWKNSNTTSLGAEVEFTCDGGFKNNGSTSRTCLPSGVWSGDEAVCHPIDCGHPDHVEHGWATYPATLVGFSSQYTCKLGYRLKGTATRVCLDSGEWSPAPPTCNLFDASVLNSAVKGGSKEKVVAHDGISTTTVAAIGVSGAVAIILIVLIGLFVCKKRKRTPPSTPDVVFTSTQADYSNVAFTNAMYEQTIAQPQGGMAVAAAGGGGAVGGALPPVKTLPDGTEVKDTDMYASAVSGGLLPPPAYGDDPESHKRHSLPPEYSPQDLSCPPEYDTDGAVGGAPPPQPEAVPPIPPRAGELKLSEC